MDTATTSAAPVPGAALRVSHEERERAVEMLQEAYADGRIQHEELDRRIEDALAAKDRADLAHALRGLPLAERYVPLPAPAMAAPGTMPPGDQRLLSLLAHWSGMFTSFIGPVLIAYTAGKNSRFVREQALEAANFQLTFIGAVIALGIVTGVTLGLAGLLFPFLFLAWFALTAVGGLSAAVGNNWRYPKTLRPLS